MAPNEGGYLLSSTTFRVPCAPGSHEGSWKACGGLRNDQQTGQQEQG